MKKTYKKIKKLNTMYHPDTKFVCKSLEDKRIVGKWINSEIVELEDDDMELIDEWKFEIYEEEGVEKSKGDDEEDEDEEENACEGNAGGDAEEEEGNAGGDAEEEEGNAGGDAEEEEGNTGGDAEDEEGNTGGEQEEDVEQYQKDQNELETTVDAILHEELKITNKTVNDSSFENLKDTGVELFEKLYNKYTEKECELVSVKQELSQLETLFNELTNKHNSLNEKFKKMKSLFD